MSEQPLKTFLFSYWYHGSQYRLEIDAYTEEEAIERKNLMSGATYDGEAVMCIDIQPKLFQRLLRWWYT